MTIRRNKQRVLFCMALSATGLLPATANAELFGLHAQASPPQHASGLVSAVEDSYRFTLTNDAWETHDIEILSVRPLTVVPGDAVHVAGSIESDPRTGALIIVADQVELSRANAAMQRVTPVSLSSGDSQVTAPAAASLAQTSIKDLPSTGPVKVIGIIDQISSDASFVIRDSTGSLLVNAEALNKPLPVVGSEVTVQGTMRTRLLQKQLAAQSLTAASSPGEQAQR